MTEEQGNVISRNIEFINGFKKWLKSEIPEIEDIEYKIVNLLSIEGYTEHVVVTYADGSNKCIDVTNESTWSIAEKVINNCKEDKNE